MFDCYMLNVAGETAGIYPYTDFHLLTITGTTVTDHGRSPSRGADNLLIDGRDAALVGGYGAEHDQITFVHIGHDLIEVTGEPRRLVLPDGLEVRTTRTFCRGTDLHVIIGTTWYAPTLMGCVAEAEHYRCCQPPTSVVAPLAAVWPPQAPRGACDSGRCTHGSRSAPSGGSGPAQVATPRPGLGVRGHL